MCCHVSCSKSGRQLADMKCTETLNNSFGGTRVFLGGLSGASGRNNYSSIIRSDATKLKLRARHCGRDLVTENIVGTEQLCSHNA